MRAIWKGYLRCSLVTIPIKTFTATTRRPLQFHLILKFADQAQINPIYYPDAYYLAPDGQGSSSEEAL